MNIIDVLLLLIIAYAAYSGWQKGFFIGLLDLISWTGTLLIGLWLYPYTSKLLEDYVKVTGVWLFPISFILTLLIARLIIGAIITPIFKAIPERLHGNKANTYLGIIPGLINGVIYAALASAIFLLIPFSELLTTKSQQSTVANLLSKHVQKLEAAISPALEDAISRSINSLIVEPTSGKTVKLHFTVKDPKPRTDLEADMLKLINRERRKEGLEPLIPDPKLVPVARAHSADMFARGYFSHISPEGATPSDRIRKAHVPFITAGENLALAQTLSIAHTGLMNSPGHRANILRPAFGRVGIGILDGGIYGLMVTQNFRN